MTEEVKTLPSSGFVGQGYVQHVESEWRGSHYAGCYTYLIPENHVSPDATTSAFGESHLVGHMGDELSAKEGEKVEKRT